MLNQRLLQAKTKAANPQPQTAKTLNSPTHPILQLQADIGNRAVNELLENPHHNLERGNQPLIQRKPLFKGLSHELIQPKLTIGEVGDKYEQEADRVSEQIVSQMNGAKNATIQRQETIGKDEDKQLRMKPTVQRLAEKNGMAAAPELSSAIQQAKSGGEPLTEQIRQPAEEAFEMPLDWVKVHTDAESDRLNQSINAVGFTNENHIFLRQQVSQPNNRENQKIYFHELTHAIQQQGGTKGPNLQRKIQGVNISAAPKTIVQRTLDEYLTQPNKMTYFRQFLQSRYNSEMLDFWQAVSAYEQNYVANTQAGANLARQLQQRFIGENAAEQINISYNQAREIVGRLDPQNNPDTSDLTNLFNDAIREIRSLLLNEYVQFQSSNFYQQSRAPQQPAPPPPAPQQPAPLPPAPSPSLFGKMKRWWRGG